ncbi:helix-turn-helix domain-containing protein [Marinobacter daepoensis]|uniref:helix-turn-helix domain-containing protein n=1 Tax=Marinobacter daepoensis TaxID=262077 RepID=UPI003B847E87
MRVSVIDSLLLIGSSVSHGLWLLELSFLTYSWWIPPSRSLLESVIRTVGYEDVSSFSRLFRRHTGLAPGAYRARFGR